MASVPDAPSPAPSSDSTVTNNEQIKVTWTAPSDGSSEIISYEVQMDDGKGGNFVSLVGYTSEYLKLYYV